VKTWHKHKGRPGKAADEFRPDRYDLAEFRAGRQGLVAFADNFTGMTPDAFLGVLEQIIFAHG
jgi:hypothetical protein